MYSSQTFGSPGQQIQVILLDLRYFQSLSTGILLGEDQWTWLEHELTTSSAQLHLIGSSVQFVDGGVEDVQATTAPVCSTPRARTGAGLCDVVGNVSEWTQTVVDVPHDERAFRVVNGGSAWAYTVEQLRPSETSIVAETSSAHGIGVRCVRKSDIR